MKVLDIINGTTVDGPGFRTAIYFAGCRHNCPGCHNPQSWDFNGGKEIDPDSLLSLIETNDMDVSLSGGDPLYQIEEILPLCRRIKELGKTIWVYTGFLYEDVMQMPLGPQLLSAIDVLVDGPFVEALRDTALLFRGSSNQRLIDCKLSTPDSITLWTSPF